MEADDETKEKTGLQYGSRNKKTTEKASLAAILKNGVPTVRMSRCDVGPLTESEDKRWRLSKVVRNDTHTIKAVQEAEDTLAKLERGNT